MRQSLQSNGTDQVAAVIKNKIDDFALQTFDKFQLYHNKLHIYPVRDALPIKDDSGQWLGYSQYSFDMYGDEPQVMEVRIDRYGGVYVHLADTWAHLAEYLARLSPPADIWTASKDRLSSDDKSKLWRDQWVWWGRNGNRFRLLDLPFEIREIIYGFAVVGTVQPYPRARCRRLLPSHAESLAARLPNVKLLRTNKQVSLEASHLLYRDSVFLIEKRPIFQDGIMAKKAIRNRIMKLNLSLSHKDFFKIFGFKVSDVRIDWKPKNAAKALRNTNLEEVLLDIAMPQKAAEAPWLERSCQKTVVDWILEAAWPWVKGHHVKLQGGVKTLQRDEFLKKCAKERAAYLRWCKVKPMGYVEDSLTEYDKWTNEEDGGVRLDGQPILAIMEEIEETEKELPPPCSCTPRCWENWTPDD